MTAPWNSPERDVTPEKVVLNRRRWLQRAGLAVGAPVGRLLGYGATYEPHAGTPAVPAV